MSGLIYRKTKQTLNYLEEKPEVFRIQNITLPKVTYEDIVEEIAQTQGCTKSQTKAVVEAFLDRAEFVMKLGHPVSLGGIGTFKPTINTKVATKLEKLGADNIVMKKIQYFPGKNLKDMMKAMPVNNYMTLNNASE